VPLPEKLLEYGDFKNFRPTKNETAEILSPASADTFRQAVYGGADAVYFGYGDFNARVGAENFSSIGEVVDFCHFFNVKAYLALNIELFDEELPKVAEVIKEAENAKIDAFIICDLSLIPLIRKYSAAPVHASTQLGIHNTWGVNFLREFNIDRAVYSREMTLEDIKTAVNATTLESEVFIHGALCSCFSGGCLLSSMLTGNSGNRGRCNQLCRMRYRCEFNGKQIDEGYLLSAKDICLDKYQQNLIDIGVNSLKIEGRRKRADYVQGVTSHYSDLKKGVTPKIGETELKKLFNRGDFTAGYFEGNDIIYPCIPGHMGIFIGKIVYAADENTAYMATKYRLFEGDGFKIIRNMKDIGGAVYAGESRNGFVTVKANFPLKAGDVVRLTNDSGLSKELESKVLRKNVPIKLKFIAGERPRLELNIVGNKYRYEPDIIIGEARTQPITKEEIINLFAGSKVRNVRFIVTEAEIGNIFLTKAQLNQIRREAIDCVWRYLLAYYERSGRIFSGDELPTYSGNKILGDFAEVNDLSQTPRLEGAVSNIVYNPNVYTFAKCKEFYNAVKNKNNYVFIKLPIYVPTGKESFFEKIIELFDGVLANNAGAVYIAHKMKKLVVCGQNLNITNTENWLIKNTNQYIVSVELNYAQLKKFQTPLVYAYGNLPLMYLNFCPRKANGKECGKCGGDICFRDEKGRYPITTQKFDGYCEHTLHNGVLTDIGNTYRGIYRYFDFSMATGEEITATLDRYFGTEDYKPADTNKLHLNRGVL
jgi:putative protease